MTIIRLQIPKFDFLHERSTTSSSESYLLGRHSEKDLCRGYRMFVMLAHYAISKCFSTATRINRFGSCGISAARPGN